MSRRRGRRPRAVEPPEPPVDPVAARRALQGQAVAIAYYLGGFAILVVCAVLQVGPYAWAAAWQHRVLGYESELFSFLPGFLALLVPAVVLAWMPRQTDPFLLGMQETARLTRRPTLPLPSVETRVGRLRRVSHVMAGLAVVAVVAGGTACWWALQPGAQAPGSTLPELDVATIGDAPLPEYALITGAVSRQDWEWVHEYHIRSTAYRDVLSPLVPPSWRAGDAVDVLELQTRLGPGGAGPHEGTLERGLPVWQIAAMRERGIRVTDNPVLLRRAALGGRVPEPDPITAAVLAWAGTAPALVFGGLFWSCRVSIRRLRQAAPPD